MAFTEGAPQNVVQSAANQVNRTCHAPKRPRNEPCRPRYGVVHWVFRCISDLGRLWWKALLVKRRNAVSELFAARRSQPARTTAKPNAEYRPSNISLVVSCHRSSRPECVLFQDLDLVFTRFIELGAGILSDDEVVGSTAHA